MSAPLPQPAPGLVAVASLAQARRHKRKWDAVLTIEDPEARPGDQLRFSASPAPAHLVLSFEDADSEVFGYATALPDDVRAALEFARAHAGGSLLVHCFHGVGRSAAVGLAILADRLGPGREVEALDALAAVRPGTTPNLVAVEYADQLLERDGALLAALLEREAGEPDTLRARQRRYDYATQNPSLYARR
ncbi:tyrosine phosphatase family protein [Erythrobacter aureus]|uniref:tyrosine phosphatase family protein n=1 Tax=Erythrobacter aureus TaxID=2182384 RepID=UPI0013B387CC|nr:dual specificity protein phosphatase family protein [Erythrobacter aureus]